MKYKITKHIPDFFDVGKDKELFVEKLDDVYNLEFVKRVRNLRNFSSFSINEDKTLLIVNFITTYYVLAHIEELENTNKGPLF